MKKPPHIATAAVSMVLPLAWFLLGVAGVSGPADAQNGSCPECPEMVVVPGGSFRMGAGDLSGSNPVRTVNVSPFAVGRYEVTRGQYAAFVSATGYDAGSQWRHPGFAQTDDHPVVYISWDDARAYVAWLSERTGKRHRLLSESEWEYAARAGTTTRYSFGASAASLAGNANCDESVCKDGYAHTSPVGRFPANTFGVHDMHGNVREWVDDCWHDGYEGAPPDGSAWTTSCNTELSRYAHRVLRGGPWFSDAGGMRAASRFSNRLTNRSRAVGFRVARDLGPAFTVASLRFFFQVPPSTLSLTVATGVMPSSSIATLTPSLRMISDPGGLFVSTPTIRITADRELVIKGETGGASGPCAGVSCVWEGEAWLTEQRAGAPDVAVKVGEVTVEVNAAKDCLECPEMVVVPGGSFRMGDLEGTFRSAYPVHTVNVPLFRVGKYEVTRGQYAAFVSATGHDAGSQWRYPGSRFTQTDDHPVANVSWDDARAYVAWLSRRTGKRYRLLTESEWEYAARAGTTTRYYFGDDEASLVGNANCRGHVCKDGYSYTSPVGRFPANAFGLHDMIGNVGEWVEDCWHDNYEGAPTDGSAWTTSCDGNPAYRVFRGGHWYHSNGIFVNTEHRNRRSRTARSSYWSGFRVAQDLPGPAFTVASLRFSFSRFPPSALSLTVATGVMPSSSIATLTSSLRMISDPGGLFVSTPTIRITENRELVIEGETEGVSGPCAGVSCVWEGEVWLTEQRAGAPGVAVKVGEVTVEVTVRVGEVTVEVDTEKDCLECPEMVVVPGGSFRMGDLSGDGFAGWRPVRTVNVPPFAVGKHEVTRGQFAAFVSATGYDAGSQWRHPGFAQTDDHPVVYISWDDARAYVAWLSERTGKRHRLLSESEWEYAARAGTTTRYSFGASAASLAGNANCDESVCKDGYAHTSPVGRFSANAFGVHDMHGNVREWVEDCWHDDYEGAPPDGSAWTTSCNTELSRYADRVLRGGPWFSDAGGMRAASRFSNRLTNRYRAVGFRVARDLDPAFTVASLRFFFQVPPSTLSLTVATGVMPSRPVATLIPSLRMIRDPGGLFVSVPTIRITADRELVIEGAFGGCAEEPCVWSGEAWLTESQAGASDVAVKVGEVTVEVNAAKDCLECPEMVVVPGGSFRMGDLEGTFRSAYPVHTVHVPLFRVGKYEVTRGQYAAFVSATGHDAGSRWRNPGSRFAQTDDHPVVNVSWDDARAYVAWLSRRTGKRYRLLSESEWEYAARAGTTTRYYFGDDEASLVGNANCDENVCKDGYRYTSPVGRFPANAFGLHDMIGNVEEWVEDCGHDNYEGAPTDGSAWTTSCDGNPAYRVLRGGHWYHSNGILVNTEHRNRMSRTTRYNRSGFRVAQDLPGPAFTVASLRFSFSRFPPSALSLTVATGVMPSSSIATLTSSLRMISDPGGLFVSTPTIRITENRELVIEGETGGASGPCAGVSCVWEGEVWLTEQRAGAPGVAVKVGEVTVEVTVRVGEVTVEVDTEKDCLECPEMVVVPGRSFRMGDLSGDGFAGWRPVRTVNVPPFAVGKHEVTRGQFAAFVSATGYDAGSQWRHPGFAQTDDHPVVYISWDDARAYVAWLSERTGKRHRLLSESEWEYAARAGTTTRYSFGASAASLAGNANCDESVCKDGYAHTSPVGRFPANTFGVHDMHGNVREWVDDCWHDGYEGAPPDGSAWTTSCNTELSRYAHRVLRGGPWFSDAGGMRTASRFSNRLTNRSRAVGFRVARDLGPAFTVASLRFFFQVPPSTLSLTVATGVMPSSSIATLTPSLRIIRDPGGLFVSVPTIRITADRELVVEGAFGGCAEEPCVWSGEAWLTESQAGASDVAVKVGEVTVEVNAAKDCLECPEMVVVPGGSFRMGDLEGTFRSAYPVHTVNVPPFAVGKYEVTRGQYAAFVSATGHDAGSQWRYPGSRFTQTDDHPVANVSWDDARAYVAWLSRRTGKRYRLLTESEWEYAARAGTTTRYYFGDDEASLVGNANCRGHVCKDGYSYTSPVGRFPANAFGLHDMIGNVGEWVEDCWHDNYEGAPTDGSAWTTSCDGNPAYRVFRGGHWYHSNGIFVNTEHRNRRSRTARSSYWSGFRVAQDLPGPAFTVASLRFSFSRFPPSALSLTVATGVMPSSSIATLTSSLRMISDPGGLFVSTPTIRITENRELVIEGETEGVSGPCAGVSCVWEGEVWLMEQRADAPGVSVKVGEVTVEVTVNEAPLVSVVADKDEVSEGMPAVFTLLRLGDLTEELTVAVSVSTQVAEIDAPGGSPAVSLGAFRDEVTFDPGEATAPLTIGTVADDAWQAHTSLTVTVEDGVNHDVFSSMSSASMLVRDDDLPAGIVISLDSSAADRGGAPHARHRVRENASPLRVEVVARTADGRRPHNVVGPVDLTINETGATGSQSFPGISMGAEAGKDFIALSESLVFEASDFVPVLVRPGSLTYVTGRWVARKFVDISIIDDMMIEGTEDFQLMMSRAATLDGEVSLGVTDAFIWILDDDASIVSVEKDCPACPEMVVVPGGSFRMGAGDLSGSNPVRTVNVSPFAVGKYEVTRGQYAAFVSATDHHAGSQWRHPGFAQTDDHPVVYISWDDARAYVAWLSRRTGKRYRLLSESEWEYAARAGTTTRYSLGDSAASLVGNANCDESVCKDGYVKTSPVGRFSANAFGVHDMHGNVREWVEDCWHDDYEGAPSDGSAWTTSCRKTRGRYGDRVLRGGPWFSDAGSMRAASRFGNRLTNRYRSVGFRVARDLLGPAFTVASLRFFFRVPPSTLSLTVATGVMPSSPVATLIPSLRMIRDPGGLFVSVPTIRITADRELVIEGAFGGCAEEPCVWSGEAWLTESQAGASDVAVKVGEVTVEVNAAKDCLECPEMVVVPGGSFRMGDLEGVSRSAYPVHTVHVPLFRVSKYEVTRGQYAAFVSATGYDADSQWRWRFPTFDQADDHPVVYISWDDARAYVAWLSRRTGKRYRLLTESEWEYAARAGTTAQYYFGDDEASLVGNANWAGYSVKAGDFVEDEYGVTSPVGRFPANAFGLHDMIGNVWEWVEDCWHDNYEGAPTDGSAWTTSCDVSPASRVRRGGSWDLSDSSFVNTTYRDRISRVHRNWEAGFRVAQDLPGPAFTVASLRFSFSRFPPSALSLTVATGVTPSSPMATLTPSLRMISDPGGLFVSAPTIRVTEDRELVIEGETGGASGSCAGVPCVWEGEVWLTEQRAGAPGVSVKVGEVTVEVTVNEVPKVGEVTVEVDTEKGCPECPEMVVVPGGSFRMGDLSGDGFAGWRPVRTVNVSPFAVGKYEVTRGQFAAFVSATDHHAGSQWRHPGFAQTDDHPVVYISWDDARAYVAWLSRRTGKHYRLLSESEWEYAARAGTTTRYSLGDSAASLVGNANCDESVCKDGYAHTSPVGRFAANAFGLHDMHGNVREWVEDCWHDDYEGAPPDGRAWTTSCRKTRSRYGDRVLRGGPWFSDAGGMRAASRFGNRHTNRYRAVGFRVARDLPGPAFTVASLRFSFFRFPPSTLSLTVATGVMPSSPVATLIPSLRMIRDPGGLFVSVPTIRITADRELVIEGAFGGCAEEPCVWSGEAWLTESQAGASDVAVKVGEVTVEVNAAKDCLECPEMVVVPGGSFRMGDLEGTSWSAYPVHTVHVPPFAVGKYEVTRGQYAAFVSATGHDADSQWQWRFPIFDQADDHPVVNVSWDDARAYVAWLSRRTGKRYRLLTESEWEYAARAGTTARYYFGDDEVSLAGNANCRGLCKDGYRYTSPVGRFPANAFGLHDMIGNVWEWVEDCWHDNYEGAPTDGSAWTTSCDGWLRGGVLRGGSWGMSDSRFVNTTYRDRRSRARRNWEAGFRVAQDLPGPVFTVASLRFSFSRFPPSALSLTVATGVTPSSPVGTLIPSLRMIRDPGGLFVSVPTIRITADRELVIEGETGGASGPCAGVSCVWEGEAWLTEQRAGALGVSVKVGEVTVEVTVNEVPKVGEVTVEVDTEKDCPECPEMVVVPGGSFRMGAGDLSGSNPVRTVNVSPFAVGKYEVTRGQYAAFVSATDHHAGNQWRHPGFAQTDDHPVVYISWDDARAYVAWLSRRTGKRYRLLSESEWEYAARAGTTTRYSFGDSAASLVGNANCDESVCKDGYVKTSPVGRFSANAFGVHDMHGNVREWVEDCWHDDYEGAPSDGSAWTTSCRKTRSRYGDRVLRGGPWFSDAGGMRAASRLGNRLPNRYRAVGFRVARDLLGPAFTVASLRFFFRVPPSTLSLTVATGVMPSSPVGTLIPSLRIIRDPGGLFVSVPTIRITADRELVIEGAFGGCAEEPCVWSGEAWLTESQAGASDVAVKVGEVTVEVNAAKDCLECPEMVVVPGGSFRMGDLEGGSWSAYPVHTVHVPPFAVGKYEVTRGQYAAFVSATGYDADSQWRWRFPIFDQADDHPVIYISWDDARAYVAWLSRRTGKRYRLLTESEWEYAARAGTTARYYFGDDEASLVGNANWAGYSVKAGDFVEDEYGVTSPVGRFPANAFGLHDMIGNVWEWVEDCWHDNYEGAPTDGSAWTTSCDVSPASRVRRGGSWDLSDSRFVNTTYRDRISRARRNWEAGFRVAQDLPGPAFTVASLRFSFSRFPPSALSLTVATGVTPSSPMATLLPSLRMISDPGGLFVSAPTIRITEDRELVIEGETGGASGSCAGVPCVWEGEAWLTEQRAGAPGVSVEVGEVTVEVTVNEAPLVSVVADKDEVSEGMPAVFTLLRLGGLSEELTVAVSVSTRVAAIDALRGSPAVSLGAFRDEVTFDPGEATARLTIGTVDDDAWQAHTSLTVTVEDGVNHSASMLVRDDDLPAGIVISLDSSAADRGGAPHARHRVREHAGPLRVEVVARTVDGRRPHNVVGSVDLTINETGATDSQSFPGISMGAEAGKDFIALSESLVFEASDFVPVLVRPGSLTYVTGRWVARKFVDISIIDDMMIEGTEDFQLMMSRAATLDGEVSLGVTDAFIWILDDDASIVSVEKDCPACPEMVVVPGGSFRMGAGDLSGSNPVHTVNVPSFAVGRYEVTRGQYAAFVSATGHDTGSRWRNPGFAQTDDHPVVKVGWNDARAYVAWLSERAGKRYRLLSESEWEYAARAGTTTRYSLGDGEASLVGSANCDETVCKDGYAHTSPVGRFSANAFGLHDMHGNVWEWVEDCGHDDYTGAPTDGSAWTTSCDEGDGPSLNRVLRGGSWYSRFPQFLRTAFRLQLARDHRNTHYGFRVARDLGPAFTVESLRFSFSRFPPSTLSLTVATGVMPSSPIATLLPSLRMISDPGGLFVSAPTIRITEDRELVIEGETGGASGSCAGVPCVWEGEAWLTEQRAGAPGVAVEVGEVTVEVTVNEGPLVSVVADKDEVSEGMPAVFTLLRLGDLSEELTVAVSVSTRVAAIDALRGSPAVSLGAFRDEVTFDPGEATARLTIGTVDDDVWQAHTSLTVTVEDGEDYDPAPGMSSATVVVRDDDVPLADLDRVTVESEHSIALVVIEDDDVVVSPDAAELDVVRGEEAELGLSLNRKYFSASSVVLTATPGLSVSPSVVEFAEGSTRATVRVSAEVDALLLPVGKVSLGPGSSNLEVGASSRVSVTVLPRTVALRLSGELEPLSSGDSAELTVATVPVLVADERMSVSVSSSSPTLAVSGSPVLLSADTPTASVTLTAGLVEKNLVVTLTATAVPENVVVDAPATMEVVVLPPEVVLVWFDPSTLTLTSRRPMSVTVTSTLSGENPGMLMLDVGLVSSVDRVSLAPNTVTLTGAEPSAMVEVSLLELLPNDGKIATVVLQGRALINGIATDGVRVVPANSLAVEFERGSLRLKIRVFLGGALPF